MFYGPYTCSMQSPKRCLDSEWAHLQCHVNLENQLQARRRRLFFFGIKRHLLCGSCPFVVAPKPLVAEPIQLKDILNLALPNLKDPEDFSTPKKIQNVKTLLKSVGKQKAALLEKGCKLPTFCILDVDRAAGRIFDTVWNFDEVLTCKSNRPVLF